MLRKGLLVACLLVAAGIAVGMILLLNAPAVTPNPAPSGRESAAATEPDRQTKRNADTSRSTPTAKETKRSSEVEKKPESPPPPAPKPVEVLDGDNRKLNRAEGTYEIEPLVGEATLKLSGKVKTLKIGAVGNSASLEVSGLEAKEIVFTGNISGRGSVKLTAPGSTIRLNGKAEGSATLEINAADGSVTFVEPSALAVGRDGSKIDGGTRIRITAKDVNLRGDIRGGSRVIVTLTRDGSLKYQEVGGAAVLQYRKADPNDPDPKISIGTISEGGKVEKID